MYQHTLKERLPAWHFTPALYIRQRAEFESSRLSLLQLKLGEPRLQGRIAWQSHSHREYVYKQTDGRFSARKISQATRYCVSKNHVIRATTPAQQQRPRALNQRVQGQMTARRKRTQFGCERLVQQQNLFRVIFLLETVGCARPVKTHGCRTTEPCQRLSPVGFRFALFLLLKPIDVVAVANRRLQLDGLACLKAFIKFKQLFKDHRTRRAIQ